MGGGPQHIVHMRGLPFRVTENDIAEWFSSVVDPMDISIIYNNQGRPTGEADVMFPTESDAQKAMTKDRQNMQHRYIELFYDGAAGGGGGGGSNNGSGGGRYGGNGPPPHAVSGQPTVLEPEPLEETVLEEVAVTVLETVTEITEETQILRQLSNRSIPYIPQDIYNWISK